jgi:two-component system chemotaxis response regulator CheB
MQRTHVLIVDDEAIVRRIVADVVAAEPGYVVSGAASAAIALAKMAQALPDVVLLDVEMPGTDGLAVLTAIRRAYPRLPVIMFSSMTERGAVVTLDALLRGADDYVTKPACAGGRDATLRRFRDELLPRIEALLARAATGEPASPPAGETRPAAVPLPAVDAAPAEVVAIGASTGGPQALHAILTRLPADLPVPIVVVLHMPALFTPYVVARLDAVCRLRVRAGADAEELQPGCVHIAPGDWHMTVSRDAGVLRSRLDQGPPMHSCRPSIDRLFDSVASAYGRHALGVALSGMGRDGVLGCGRIRAAGGTVLAQDRDTSVVWGIPGFVVRAGFATAVLPLDGMAAAIRERTVGGRLAVSGAGDRERSAG